MHTAHRKSWASSPKRLPLAHWILAYWVTHDYYYFHTWSVVSKVYPFTIKGDCGPRNSLCVRWKQTWTSPEMLIYIGLLKGDNNSTKVRSFSTIHSDLNCKHSLNFTCHAHNRDASEVTKWTWGWRNPNMCIYMQLHWATSHFETHLATGLLHYSTSCASTVLLMATALL